MYSQPSDAVFGQRFMSYVILSSIGIAFRIAAELTVLRFIDRPEKSLRNEAVLGTIAKTDIDLRYCMHLALACRLSASSAAPPYHRKEPKLASGSANGHRVLDRSLKPNPHLNTIPEIARTHFCVL